ncbi:MAG: oxamate carbamoyltransferase subunit AllH family protein [Angustibacter sp.]
MNPQVGAASTYVHDLLTEPPRRGVVHHVGRGRAAVEVAGRLLVLERSAGDHTLPCSVVVPSLDPADLTDLDGAAAAVGGEQVVLGERTVEVVRWWEPARVRAGTSVVVPSAPAAASVLDDDTRRALQEAAAAVLAGRTDAAAEQLVGVLGRGRGSTPDADDAVAGLLLAARRAGRPGTRPDDIDNADTVGVVAATVARVAPTRTTLLSAELLRAAASGFAAPVLVRHLTSPSAGTAAAVRRLGATSGRATLEGVSLLDHAWQQAARRAVAA